MCRGAKVKHKKCHHGSAIQHDISQTDKICKLEVQYMYAVKEGEEIAYNYGGEDCPWRTQTTSITVNTMEEDDSDPVHSESLMDCAFGPKTTPEE
ncbi:unnamed protein product, partial [Pleuronectes platessa]